MNIPPKALLKNIVDHGIITADMADQYELDSIKKNKPIYDYLLTETKVERPAVLKAAADALKIPCVDLSTSPVDPQAANMVSESIARRFHIIPYRFDSKTDSLYVATDDPFDTQVTEFLEKKINKKIVLVLADLPEIEKAFTHTYTQGLSPEVSEALKEYIPQEQQGAIEDIGSVIREAPIAKIVTTILEFAIKSRASDIHIEAEETKTRVRYRVDGILNEKLTLPVSIHDPLISRIKILSQMKIDEKRIPQDGRFTFKLGHDEVDLRVSSLPTVHGEKIVMRLLRKTGGLPTLADLGLRGVPLKDFESAFSEPYGIVLVTGPTGSGKTTTLYSVLTRLNKPSVNIITLEDPVEYQLDGVNQVQINAQAGLTFANGLRSFLRQDPNVILVGEIRDKETTQLAIQAALTGHLVLSTLHTNDAATAIPRLIDLGGEAFLIASVLAASLAQRIVRRICEHCRKEYVPDAAIAQSIQKTLGTLTPKKYEATSEMKLFKGTGCSECSDTGYLGRVGIFEVLRVTPAINKLILNQATADEITNQARADGMISMKQDGFLKALDGITTVEEVLRVAEE